MWGQRWVEGWQDGKVWDSIGGTRRVDIKASHPSTPHASSLIRRRGPLRARRVSRAAAPRPSPVESLHRFHRVTAGIEERWPERRSPEGRQRSTLRRRRARGELVTVAAGSSTPGSMTTKGGETALSLVWLGQGRCHGTPLAMRWLPYPSTLPPSRLAAVRGCQTGAGADAKTYPAANGARTE